MSAETTQSCKQNPRLVAVFDLDGTCITGQSGRLIAIWLLRHGRLSPYVMHGLAWWGFRYVLHLPNRQERSRELIFRNLSKLDPSDVDRIMVDFHKEVMVPRYRPRALKEISLLKERGYSVVLISATFDIIAREAAQYLGADGYVATQMERNEQGRYTGFVLGDVVEGHAKVGAVHTWANERFGVGGWVLDRAYGDHYTDVELLRESNHPLAVSPGFGLRRAARRYGWPMENWKAR